jgi:hypothetical protein
MRCGRRPPCCPPSLSSTFRPEPRGSMSRSRLRSTRESHILVHSLRTRMHAQSLPALLSNRPRPASIASLFIQLLISRTGPAPHASPNRSALRFDVFSIKPRLCCSFCLVTAFYFIQSEFRPPLFSLLLRFAIDAGASARSLSLTSLSESTRASGNGINVESINDVTILQSIGRSRSRWLCASLDFHLSPQRQSQRSSSLEIAFIIGRFARRRHRKRPSQ